MVLLHTWGEKSPERCGRILHSLFEAWFALNPRRNPFERDELKEIDTYSLAELAKKAPKAFLQGTTDSIVRSIDMVFAEGNTGGNWYSFNYRTYTGHRFGFDEFLGMYRSVLRKVVQETPEIAINYLDKLDPHKHQCLMHLHLNRSGYEQWCILETIGEELLSSIALSRLHQLRRKFPKTKIAKPNHMEVYSVRSPIKRAQCGRMKDHHWLSAIERYDSDEDSRYGHDCIDGGARQLATELQEATQKDPARFSDLSLKIPDTAHHSYIEHILWGLAETEASSDESLAQAAESAHQHPEKPFGSDIARLVEKHPHIAGDFEILEILIWYATAALKIRKAGPVEK